MLVPLPIGAFVSSLIFDILTQTRAGSLPYLVDGAFWLIGVGLAGALVAAVPGMLDLRMIARGATCPRHRAHAPDAERRGARAVRGRLCPTGLRGRATRGRGRTPATPARGRSGASRRTSRNEDAGGGAAGAGAARRAGPGHAQRGRRVQPPASAAGKTSGGAASVPGLPVAYLLRLDEELTPQTMPARAGHSVRRFVMASKRRSRDARDSRRGRDGPRLNLMITHAPTWHPAQAQPCTLSCRTPAPEVSITNCPHRLR
jgi:hypothetical protein